MMPSSHTMAVINMLNDFDQWQQGREEFMQANDYFGEPYVDLDICTLQQELNNMFKFAVLRELTENIVENIETNT